MKKSTIVTGIVTIVFYLLLLSLYLLEKISAVAFIFSLALALFVLIISWLILSILFLIRRKKSIMGKIAISTGLLIALFCYELPLILYPDKLSHIAHGYVEPYELIEGSGIYSIAVEEFQLENMKSHKDVEQFLRNQNVEVLTIEDISNKMIYGVKNRQLLKWLHLQKEHSPAESRENVISYLGEERDWLEGFFGQHNMDGDSAGLSLALSGRYEDGDFKNHLPIAITGAINEKGDVLEVGVLKEKIQITEKAGIPYLIIPSKNGKEVEKIQKDLKANVEIFEVSTVDEAIHVIKELNEKTN